jgi:beta-glucosidase
VSNPAEFANTRLFSAVCIVFPMALASLGCSEPAESVSLFHNPKMPVERRVADLMGRLEPEEKVALARGADRLATADNKRLGIPALVAVAGAMGVSAKDAAGHPIPATAFPANIGMGATWNARLLQQTGAVIAQQARSLGRGEILGPVTDIGSVPFSGRFFETYGEDPWLVAHLADGYISGVQGEGEIAAAIYSGQVHATQAAREFELRPLEAAVTQAGVWSVTTDATNSPGAFLRDELGFRGFTAASGLPRELYEGEIDDQVRGMLRAMFASGAFDRVDKTAASVKETPEQRALARSAAAQSIVLLKNDGGLLPLDPKRIHSIAVLGPNASVSRMAGGNYTVAARYSDTPLDALRAVFGPGVVAANSPAEAAKADVAIVFAGTGASTEGESVDRTSLHLPAGQEELIEAVAQANHNTIVVLIAGYPVDTGKWIGGVPALLDAWFPGEEGGHAIADVLTGAVNPSGRLPVALPGAMFPFGFGLSYTQFEYSDLAIVPVNALPDQFVEVSVGVRNTGSRAGRETAQLYLKGDLKGSLNAGPGLSGIQQVDLNPGESTRAHFTLTPVSMSHFDERLHDWAEDQGVFEVGVGASSVDIRAKGTFVVRE